MFFINYRYSEHSLVEFASPESAAAALSFNGSKLDGREVVVRIDRKSVKDPEGVKVFIGNVPWATTEDDLTELLREYNPLKLTIATNLAGQSKGFAIAIVDNEDVAASVTAALHQADFKGRALEVTMHAYHITCI